MAGWHHRLDGHEFEQTLGDTEGQGSLACCSPWGGKESDTTERLNDSFHTQNKQQENGGEHPHGKAGAGAPPRARLGKPPKSSGAFPTLFRLQPHTVCAVLMFGLSFPLHYFISTAHAMHAVAPERTLIGFYCRAEPARM